MPSILDFFRASISGGAAQVNPLHVAQVVGQFAHTLESYGNDRAKALLTHVLAPWAIGIAQKAPTKWLLPSTIPPVCAHEEPAGICAQYAMGGCHLCGRPVCLGHALVSADATLVCWSCMKLAAQHTKPWQPSPQQARGAPAGANDWAYDLLGIDKDATALEAKKAYKRKVAQYHPDRHDSASAEEKRTNGDLVRSFKKAYDVVVADIDKRKGPAK